MPIAIIIAGPNGAGKTTFADEYLASKNTEFINADEIARGAKARSDISAARTMLRLSTSSFSIVPISRSKPLSRR